MKALKFVALGMAMSFILACGVFDEAGDAQRSSQGWCVGQCQK